MLNVIQKVQDATKAMAPWRALLSSWVFLYQRNQISCAEYTQIQACCQGVRTNTGAFRAEISSLYFEIFHLAYLWVPWQELRGSLFGPYDMHCNSLLFINVKRLCPAAPSEPDDGLRSLFMAPTERIMLFLGRFAIPGSIPPETI